MSRTASHRVIESFSPEGDRAAALLRYVCDAIDAIHGVEGRTSYDFLYEATTNGAQGQHFPPPGATVIVDPSAPHPVLTAIHEIGHVLDATLLKAALRVETGVATPKYASNLVAEDRGAHLEAGGLLKAMEESQRVAGIREAVRNPNLEGALRGRLAKLLTPRELWAYGYEQFIALRSSEASIVAEMEAQRGILVTVGDRPLYYCWRESDFGAVDAAFVALFESVGWL